MKKTIYCKRCCGEIESKSDLVVTTHLFEVAAYHESCYSKEMKTVNAMFLDKPLNSRFATYFILIFALPLLILAFFFPAPYNFILFASVAITLGLRAYSWFKYERHLN